MALQNKLLKKIINIPWVLNFGQNFLGANQFKSQLYKSVFAGKPREGLLDFGCSYGNTTHEFLDFKYYGVDIDCDAIEVAKKRFKKYPNVNFECIDILKATYRSDFFDYVLFASTSHHISDEDLRPIFQKLLITLKPGGEIYFIDIFRKPDDKLWTRLLTRFDQGKYIRTLPDYENFFESGNYQVIEKKVFKSPDRFFQLWDFLLVRIQKP